MEDNFFSHGIKQWKLLLTLCAVLNWTGLRLGAEVNPRFYAVEVSATVQTSPPQIRLTWPADPNARGYTVYRKGLNDTSWGSGVSLGATAANYTDHNVVFGGAYEYRISKTADRYAGHGYIYAGIEAPLVDQRGKVLLIIETTHAVDLASELQRLQLDLAGDGWTVVRRDISRSQGVAAVKNIIRNEYNADPAGMKAVFLFGNVPVPYSGNFTPDGHPDHRGAWPADVFYGDIDGTWTDSSVNTTSAQRPANRNVPGDGKFDQSEIPSNVEVAVGRVDLSNMTCFSNKTPSRNERDLLRQYLNKNHRFRHKLINPERRGLVCDNFGEREGEAFASSGWRNFAPFFGAANVTQVPGWQYFPTVTAQSYLWSYGTGGGSYYTCNGIGGSDDFALNDVKSVFTMFLGSYFGDWDNESNFLRAPLGGTTHTLVSVWAGRPHWFLHHMALGEPISRSTVLSQNNNSFYAPVNFGSRGVHIALMGDPTLRMHPVAPPSHLRATTNGSSLTLTWNAPSESALRGYHVYRSANPFGPFTRLTGSPVSATSYTHNEFSSGTYYMVRAIRLETSGSGTYLNPSQGIFFPATATSSESNSGGGPSPSAPSAPANFSATGISSSEVRLTWTESGSNASQFKIERKTGSGGTFAQIATVNAGVTSYVNGALNVGTEYVYRVRASNSVGDSPYSAEASAILFSLSTAPAGAVFVRSDTVTRGSWKGAYGSEGYQVIGNASNLPGSVQVSASGKADYTWATSTASPQALEKVPGPDRIAACWYAPQSFSIRLNLVDGKAHQVALYFLDWDNVGRAQQVDVLNSANGALLDTRTISNFSGGQYLVWQLSGDVTFRVTRGSGNNAVLMGLFFDPAIREQPTGGVISPPAMTGILNEQGRLNLCLSGEAGQRFVIEASDDLQTWTPVSTNTLIGSTLELSAPGARTSGSRFYRVVAPE
jgi:hypothetical protein